MTRIQVFTALLVLWPAVAACGPFYSGDPGPERGSVSLADATAEAARYVEFVTGDAFEDTYPASHSQNVAQIGCRQNRDSLMSEGPPWQVRNTWSRDDPPGDFVTAALRRLNTLAEQGFERQPWTRPEPEPPNRGSYRDARGYSVSAEESTKPSGIRAFTVTAMSPCAD